MDDEEFVEFDLAEFMQQPLPSRRFRKSDLVVLPLHLAHGLASAVANTLEIAHDLAAMHSNWDVDRDAFHQSAALEIETLTNGEVDG